jgi:hypothetical protein
MASLLDSVWYRGNLDEDWQDWTIAAPRSLDCDNAKLIDRRLDHRWNWQDALSSYEVRTDQRNLSVSFNDPAVRRWTPLIDAFAAGLFCYWLGWQEIVCVPRPALWIENNRFHREDGPAVDWADERQYFVHGVRVPNWMFERPEKITATAIQAEPNVEIRRWMLERFGFGRFLRRSGTSLIAQDGHGRLWRTALSPQGQSQPRTILEVQNGTREPDGTYRQYFLSVPPDMDSPRAAVAWTYGVTTEQYELAVRT